MTDRPVRTRRGSCHCGAVRFEIETDFPELTTCNCSICRRKNALMVKVHESRFRLLAGEECLTLYQFHTFTAKHYFCKVCGIYPFHRKRVTPDHFGIKRELPKGLRSGRHPCPGDSRFETDVERKPMFHSQHFLFGTNGLLVCAATPASLGLKGSSTAFFLRRFASALRS